MELYHYNAQLFKELKSIFLRGVTKEDKKRLGEYAKSSKGEYAYIKNLSFFTAPVPRNLATILNHEHPFWIKGKLLYEHIVDTKDLPPDVPFRLVESPERTDLLYNKQNWDLVMKGNTELENLYLKQLEELETTLKLKGKGVSDMVKVSSKYTNLEPYFKQLYKMHKKYPEDNLLGKYAPLVPHLMIYTAEHPVKVSRNREVILT